MTDNRYLFDEVKVDESVYLEDVLPAYQAGEDIELLEGPNGPVVITLNKFKKVWRIKSYVLWPEAWTALQEGKRIKDLQTGRTYKIQNNTLLCLYPKATEAWKLLKHFPATWLLGGGSLPDPGR